MPVETDIERRLRTELRARSITDPLPERVLIDSLATGRTTLHARRRRAALGAAGVLTVLAALTVAVAQRGDEAPEPAPSVPTPAPKTVTGADTWAASLPQGGPADVAYLAGTTVVEPDGTRVALTGTDAAIVGEAAAGLVVLVETEVQQPYSFSSRYVLVRPTGEVAELPSSTMSRHGAQEALVSPDGRFFVSAGGVLDLADFSVAAQVPDEAYLLVAWTPVGIVYFLEGRALLPMVSGRGADRPAVESRGVRDRERRGRRRVRHHHPARGRRHPVPDLAGLRPGSLVRLTVGRLGGHRGLAAPARRQR